MRPARQPQQPPPPWQQPVRPAGPPRVDLNSARVRWRQLASEGMRLSKVGTRPETQAQAEAFTALYRRSATELARIRAFSPNKRLAEYVESAVATAHFAVYRKDSPGWRAAVAGFFGTAPRLIRQHWRYHLLSLLILVVSTLIAFGAVLSNPDSYYLFVDAELASGRDPYASPASLRASLQGQEVQDAGKATYFASFLFTHNTQVAFWCFALGLLLGLPTLYMLFKTGLMLGGFTAVFYKAGLTVEFMAWLWPHGVPEIGAIVLCAGAGLLMAHRLMNPGEEPRGVVLSRAAGEASVTAMAAVPMLLVAGLIEGIFRQTTASVELRYLLMAFMILVVGAWIGLGGRGRATQTLPAS